jgi:hypothetical protein
VTAARRLAGPLAAGLAVAAYAAAFRRYGLYDAADEGLLLAQAWRTLAGQVPHVDFHTGYGSLYFALEARLLALGGVEAIRWGLVAVHGATAACCYALARRLAGAPLAAAAVALEVAFFLPVAPAWGAPFNVPYPAWYAGLASAAAALLLAGGAPLLGHASAGALGALLFAVKPNSGLLLLGGAAAAAVLGDGRGGGAGLLGTAVLALLGLGAVVLVAPTGLGTTACALVPPVLALAALGRRRGVPDREAGPALAAQAVAALVVGAAGVGPLVVALGPLGFAREMLLLGSGVAGLYSFPLPWSAGVAGAAGIVAFVRPRLGVAAGLVALAVAVMAGAVDGVTMPIALRLGGEQAAVAVVPLALWGALAVVSREGGRALAAVTAVGAVAALQLYPRADLAHVMPLAPLVLPPALFLWGRASRAWRVVAVAVPLALAAGRIAPTAAVLARMARGDVAEVRLGATKLVVERAGAERLTALGAAVDAVDARSAPEDRVLGFPACAAVAFFARRLPAGPHDYFHPGRPDRAEAAALAARFDLDPPPLAVTCRSHDPDLERAWEYYPEMVSLLATRYDPVVARDSVNVLTRRR